MKLLSIPLLLIPIAIFLAILAGVVVMFTGLVAAFGWWGVLIPLGFAGVVAFAGAFFR